MCSGEDTLFSTSFPWPRTELIGTSTVSKVSPWNASRQPWSCKGLRKFLARVCCAAFLFSLALAWPSRRAASRLSHHTGFGFLALGLKKESRLFCFCLRGDRRGSPLSAIVVTIAARHYRLKPAGRADAGLARRRRAEARDFDVDGYGSATSDDAAIGATSASYNGPNQVARHLSPLKSVTRYASRFFRR